MGGSLAAAGSSGLTVAFAGAGAVTKNKIKATVESSITDSTVTATAPNTTAAYELTTTETPCEPSTA